MKPEEIIEGDKLIAEFMGYKQDNDYWIIPAYSLYLEQNNECWYELKFHSSWDWLMPVVEKIAEQGTYDFFPMGSRMVSRPSIIIKLREVEIYYHDRKIDYKDGVHIVVNGRGDGYEHPMYGKHIFLSFDFDNGKLIEAAWMAVVEFIKWYNQVLNLYNHGNKA